MSQYPYTPYYVPYGAAHPPPGPYYPQHLPPGGGGEQRFYSNSPQTRFPYDYDRRHHSPYPERRYDPRPPQRDDQYFDRRPNRSPSPPPRRRRSRSPYSSPHKQQRGSPARRRGRSPTFDAEEEDRWTRLDERREADYRERHRADMASGAAPPEPEGMDDYWTIRMNVSYMTVDKLKTSIRFLNSRLPHTTGLKLSGNKPDLVERVRLELESSKTQRDLPRFHIILNCLADAGLPFTPERLSEIRTAALANVAPAPPPYNPPIPGPSAYNRPPSPPKPASYGGSSSSSYPPAAGPSHLPPVGPATLAGVPIKFRYSPFFLPDSVVMGRVDLGTAAEGDRRSVAGFVTLTSDQKAKLMAAKISPSNPQFQIRLYSCSGEFFHPPPFHYRGGVPFKTQPNGDAPVEFPGACEVKVDGSPIPSAKLKGIKKKIGSTCPPDLTRLVNLNASRTKVDFVWVNTQKRYYAIAYLVETTSVEALQERVKKGKFRSKEDVMAQIRRSALDDEIQATSSELSLKDPLTFSRIVTPARGIHCQHLQSFELNVFLLSNEQTPIWECPICSQPIRFDDLILDGYMEDILKNAGDVDSVSVDDQGRWSVIKSNAQSASPSRGGNGGGGSDDDFSDDELEITRETSRRPPVRASTSTAPINLDGTSPDPIGRGSGTPAMFIDLTASDDDEIPEPPRLNAGAPAFNPGVRRAGSNDVYNDDDRGAPRPRW